MRNLIFNYFMSVIQSSKARIMSLWVNYYLGLGGKPVLHFFYQNWGKSQYLSFCTTFIGGQMQPKKYKTQIHQTGVVGMYPLLERNVKHHCFRVFIHLFIFFNRRTARWTSTYTLPSHHRSCCQLLFLLYKFAFWCKVGTITGREVRFPPTVVKLALNHQSNNPESTDVTVTVVILAINDGKMTSPERVPQPSRAPTFVVPTFFQLNPFP